MWVSNQTHSIHTLLLLLVLPLSQGILSTGWPCPWKLLLNHNIFRHNTVFTSKKKNRNDFECVWIIHTPACITKQLLTNTHTHERLLFQCIVSVKQQQTKQNGFFSSIIGHTHKQHKQMFLSCGMNWTEFEVEFVSVLLHCQRMYSIIHKFYHFLFYTKPFCLCEKIVKIQTTSLPV